MGDDKQSSRSPNARLQDRIILYLGRHDEVRTVTGLSQELRSPRTSTSRAINRLKREGLVQKIDSTWSLTEEGRAEETQLREQLFERSRRANREINRILRLQKDLERTMGISTLKQVNSTMRSLSKMPRIPSGLENVVSNLAQSQANIPKIPPILPKTLPITSNVSNIQKAMGTFGSSPFRIQQKLRPFSQAMRLVDSVGVGSPAISSSLKAISDSVRVNQSAYLKAISQAAPPGNLTSNKVESLYGTLNLINKKLGDGAFGSVQVRAVEDLLKRIPFSPIISTNAIENMLPHVELASGKMVRQILEQADVENLLQALSSPSSSSTISYSVEDDPPTASEDTVSTTSGTGSSPSGYPVEDLGENYSAQTWEELPEAVKLRFVAVATFIILHVALLAVQDQPDGSRYMKDLVLALTGTAAVVAICKQIELFEEE